MRNLLVLFLALLFSAPLFCQSAPALLKDADGNWSLSGEMSSPAYRALKRSRSACEFILVKERKNKVELPDNLDKQIRLNFPEHGAVLLDLSAHLKVVLYSAEKMESGFTHPFVTEVTDLSQFSSIKVVKP